MYVIACSRCQKRLTEHEFTTYAEAQEAARTLGYPADKADELWCEDCAPAEQRQVGLRRLWRISGSA